MSTEANTSSSTQPSKTSVAWANFRAKSVAAWRSATAWVAAALGVGAQYVDVIKEELPAVAPYIDARLISGLAVVLIILRVRSVRAKPAETESEGA